MERASFSETTKYYISLLPRQKDGSKKIAIQMYVGDRSDGYPFEGFYIHYPNDDKPLGLVSMVSDDPPAMNWIYVDKNTMEVKYGNRTASIEHIVGPWDWTEDELGVTLEGEERFVAVEEKENVWAVYYDRNDDGKSLPAKRRVLDVSLERRMVIDINDK